MDMDTVHDADRRVHSHLAAGSAPRTGPRARFLAGVVAGLRAGARHEHRQHVHRLQSLLSTLGMRASLAPGMALVSWAALAVATVLGAQAPPLRTLAPAAQRWLVPLGLLVILGLLILALARHLTTVARRHRTLLLVLPGRTRWGLVAGLSLTHLPAGVVMASQVTRGGLADLPGATVLLVQTFLDAASGAAPTWLAVRWGIAAVVVISMGMATTRASRWIGQHGLGPRVPVAHRSAGRTVGVLLGLSWAGALGQHLLVAGALMATLLLRARHIRFMSPETLGYGLRLAEQAGADPHRIAALSRRNTVILLTPAHLGAALLLVAHGSAFTVVFSAALAVLELALAELIVQRSTVVLPASGLFELTLESKAGLAAAMCLAVVFTTTGSGGLFTIFDFGVHRTAVAAASLLLIVSAVTIAWIVRIDTPRWLTGLRATPRSVP
jgi:hypothetical protein